ncbi:MAG: dihydropteroate synthase, partial [Candidatus Aminicenantes bacterium]
SFSDGGFYLKKDKAVEHGLRMISDGADIIDVGGESTRPGSDPIPTEEELRRVLPVISGLRKHTKSLISVDTSKSEVAQHAIAEGADIINDISALRNDPKMISIAAEAGAPVVLMHMKGNPKTMQHDPSYEDVVSEIKTFLQETIASSVQNGIDREKIIIDPGIGFGKRFEDNLTLIRNLNDFATLDQPILVGISRKSFIGKILDLPPREREEGTLASAILSVIQGAHILRVHEVAPVKRAILVAETILDDRWTAGLFGDEGEFKSRHVN